MAHTGPSGATPQRRIKKPERQPRPRPTVVTASTTTDMDEETRTRLETLQDTLGDLQEALMLTTVYDELEDMETTLSMLPSHVEALRTRGYVFRNYLEKKVTVMDEKWEEMYERVADEVSRQARELERESDVAESALRRATGGDANAIARAESAIDTLEHKIDAAGSAIANMYDTLRQNVSQTDAEIEQIDWMLDQIDEASFSLYPAEDPVMACRAQFMKSEKDGPKGILYLTDERLIFEQKEKITTKKVLFIPTEKETVQETRFTVTVGQIEETMTQQKGFLGHKELLDLQFSSNAALSGARFRLRGAENETWAGLIGRVKSGEIAKERTKPKDKEAVEAARQAPTKCTTCGATLDVEIVRGMREITCEYCGSVIRL